MILWIKKKPKKGIIILSIIKKIFLSNNPVLASEWHPTKNGDLTPNDVMSKSGKKVWWKCEKEHEWEATVANRSNGRGCPKCGKLSGVSNRQETILGNRNSLQDKYPNLAKQWHPSKNGDLIPSDVTTGSGKKVWWQCEKGHEWEAVINSRSSGTGCPYCSGQRASVENNLQNLNPELVKQWHFIKNEDVNPKDVTVSSSKKVWWKCDADHEWEATIAHRTNGTGCPYCFGKRASVENNLQSSNPDLARQWHPTKNGDLTPNDVTTGSNKKVWWQCVKEHEWEATIVNRIKGSDCPFCYGRCATSDNNLQILNPKVANEWHPNKNGKLNPKDVTVSSGKKVWWKCVKNHEWEAVISNRSKGIGCPECSKESKTSFPEQAIYFYIKRIYNDTLNRYKYDGKWEIDVFVPSLNFGIEYDGFYYHDENRTSDLKKEKYLTDKGLALLRVKEVQSQKNDCYLKSNTLYLNTRFANQVLNEIIKLCICYISDNISHKTYSIDIDVEHDRNKIYELFIQNEKENSLLSQYPELAKQWHPTKNLRITPDMVNSKTHKKVWWICEQNHEWQASVGSRSKGHGCPYCSGRFASSENNLQTLYPGLAKQWHPSKNGDLNPNDVTASSNKRAWWQCEKGHEWEAIINNRSKGRGCPYCAGRQVSSDNNLQVLNPELAKQWHPTKNGDLTTLNVTLGSGKKVWWLCEKGHEWEAGIVYRSNGNSCPYCSGHRVCVDNSLQTLNPELAKQWHPTKNGNLTALNVTLGSGKKVWWQCEKGHEWKAVIQSRKNGTRCPVCR